MNHFSNSVLLLALTGALLSQEPTAPPDPAAAVARLQQTLADKEAGPVLAAIEACGRVPSDDVVKLLAKALSHKEPLVQQAALQALRFSPQPAALTALIAAADNQKLLADDKQAAAYYLALGQRGDAKALPVLTKGLRIERGSPVVTARILAIGHIRTPQSVEALMRLLKSGGNGGGNAGRGGGSGGGNNPHMRDLRLALVALTGEDQGNDESGWIRWWGEHNDNYKLPAKEGELGKGLGRTWENTWRDPAQKPARTDRGKDQAKTPDDGAGKRGG